MKNRSAVKYIYDTNPLFVYLKKHYCPNCGSKLERRYLTEIVNAKSKQAERYDFSVGDTFFRGDVEFRTIYFHCPNCYLDILPRQMKT